MKPDRIDFTLNLRDVLRNSWRHTQHDLLRLVDTLRLIVEGRDWEHYNLPDLTALIERNPEQGGCAVPSSEMVAFLRLALETTQWDRPTQQTIEQIITALESPTRRTVGQRRRRRAERLRRILTAEDVESIATALRHSLTPTQQADLSARLRDG